MKTFDARAAVADICGAKPDFSSSKMVKRLRKRVAVIGEALVELNGTPFGTVRQTFGGDTLNTALYLTRLAGDNLEVKYVTALGEDCLSAGMLQRWRSEGLNTELVLRDARRLPGLYWIQVDERGERTFQYWRAESAARYLLQHPDFQRVAEELLDVDLIYLTGISLATLPATDRERLTGVISGLAARGITLALDTNYRPRLWPSQDAAREAITALLPVANLVFATFDDERQLWCDATPEAALARLHAAKARFVIVKLGAAGCLYSDGSTLVKVPAYPVETVVDTTAAGDAFNAGFLAAWLIGQSTDVCCRAGNGLAGAVIQHQGAIIPASATPALGTLISSCQGQPSRIFI